MTSQDSRIPVTVLTGFLGSGKTTLLNRVLTHHHGKRIAVIENEYGEIGIDNELIVNADEEIFEMNNGCICCTVRGDLIRILGNLVKRRNQFDYILIETTGLADPAPVAQTFFVDEEMKEHFRLDAIVTVVDALHVWNHIESSSECQEQIAFADVLLLNKIDLVPPAEVDRLEKRIRSMNSHCRVHRTRNAELPMEHLLDVRAFDLEATLEVKGDFLQEESPYEWAGRYRLEAGEHQLGFQSGPDPEMRLLLLPLPGDGDWEEARGEATRLFPGAAAGISPGKTLQPALQNLQMPAPGGDGECRYLLTIPEPGHYALFTQHRPEEFAMTFTRAGQELEPEEQREFAASHTHDATVGSVGLRDERPLDLEKVNAWISRLLREKGTDIFRMKGIIQLADNPRRLVFQGVHMLFDGKLDRPWAPDEPRRSEMIFIGRNLNRKELELDFQECLAKPALAARP